MIETVKYILGLPDPSPTTVEAPPSELLVGEPLPTEEMLVAQIEQLNLRLEKLRAEKKVAEETRLNTLKLVEKIAESATRVS